MHESHEASAGAKDTSANEADAKDCGCARETDVRGISFSRSEGASVGTTRPCLLCQITCSRVVLYGISGL